MTAQRLRLDHLMWGAASLEQGMKVADRLFSVQAARGGSHAGLGTCNALMSLGDDVYLEIIAPDPDQQVDSGFVQNLKNLPEPALITFAVGSGELAAVAERAAAAGLKTLGPQATQRQTPAGDMLAWELLHFADHNFAGLMPFAIDWQQTPNPALSNPTAGTYESLEIFSPQAQALQGLFSTLQIDVPVMQADEAALVATISAESGPVALKSTPASLTALRG